MAGVTKYYETVGANLMLRPEPGLLQAIADSDEGTQNIANQVLDAMEQLTMIFNSPAIANGSLEEKQKTAKILNEIRPKIEGLSKSTLKELLKSKYDLMVNRKRSF